MRGQLAAVPREQGSWESLDDYFFERRTWTAGMLLAATLLTLEGVNGPEHWIGYQNFYVITRYNWSSYYAMAVIELGREVKEALARQQALRTP